MKRKKFYEIDSNICLFCNVACSFSSKLSAKNVFEFDSIKSFDEFEVLNEMKQNVKAIVDFFLL